MMKITILLGYAIGKKDLVVLKFKSKAKAKFKEIVSFTPKHSIS